MQSEVLPAVLADRTIRSAFPNLRFTEDANLRAGRNSAGRPRGVKKRATLKLYSGKPREGRRTGAAYHWHDGISESTAHALAGLGKFFNPPSTARLDVLRGLVHTAKGSMMALPVLCSISFTFSPAGRARVPGR